MQQFSDVMTGIKHTNYARFVSASFEKLGLPDEDAAVAAETCWQLEQASTTARLRQGRLLRCFETEFVNP
jgi:hypothetical protein